MKKSDFLEKLKESLQRSNLFPNVFDSTSAKDIFNIVSELGMLPPHTKDYYQDLMNIYIDPNTNKWDEDIEDDERVQELRARKQLKGNKQ